MRQNESAVRGNGRTGCGVGLVRCAGRHARAGFNGDSNPLCEKRLKALGKESDTCLSRSGFLEDA